MFCLKYCLTRRVLPHRITIISLFLLNLSTSDLTQGAGTLYLRDDLEAYLRIPSAQRPPVAYLAKRGTRDLPRFSRAQRETLSKSAGAHGATAEEVAREVRERLLIELSYASSNLEGNTYDLLQTEALIKYGQVAK